MRETEAETEIDILRLIDRLIDKYIRPTDRHSDRYVHIDMKCLEGGNREQHAGTSPGKTEEMQGQESYHRTQSLQASVPLTLGKESRRKIK